MKASLDENDIDAQKYIVKLEKNCPACALGNMMLSHVRLFDQVTLDQLTGDREDITDVLEDYFDSDQLYLIEIAFESDATFYNRGNEDREKAGIYARKYENPKHRLRAIMVNIIKNKGTFSPEDFRTEEEKKGKQNKVFGDA
jgi:ribosomal protein S27AE